VGSGLAGGLARGGVGMDRLFHCVRQRRPAGAPGEKSPEALRRPGELIA
jgi:hypothetical protein